MVMADCLEPTGVPVIGLLSRHPPMLLRLFQLLHRLLATGFALLMLSWVALDSAVPASLRDIILI